MGKKRFVENSTFYCDNIKNLIDDFEYIFLTVSNTCNFLRENISTVNDFSLYLEAHVAEVSIHMSSKSVP